MKMFTDQIERHIADSSWIRRMFEIGLEMKQKHGAENVFDFTLGNPDVPAPPEVAEALADFARQCSQPRLLGYVPNAGISSARRAVAGKLSEEQGVSIDPDHVVLTCGAAGALNVIFKTILDRGEEVVCSAPFFAEYRFYVENHGGQLVPVKSRPLTFELDLEAIENAMTENTRAVLINSPNNPSGQIYSEEEMRELAAIMKRHSINKARPVYLLTDEPYRFLAYDGAHVPALLPLYEYSIVASSFSKSHSLAGERIGYLAVNPDMPDGKELLKGLIMCNRTLGFVNAPVIAQYMIEKFLDTGVDLAVYSERRAAMAHVLEQAGIEFTMPRGAFYFFAQTPGGLDDMEWINRLREQRILSVPGQGFGYPGYFRLSFAVDLDVIKRSEPGFVKAVSPI